MRALLIRNVMPAPSGGQSKEIEPPSWPEMLQAMSLDPKPVGLSGGSTTGPFRSVQSRTSWSSSAVQDTSSAPVSSDVLHIRRVQSQLGSTENDGTSVVITHDAASDPPTITGATASQPVRDDSQIQPFAGLTVTDPGAGTGDVFTIRLVDGAIGEQTDAFGTLRTTTGSASLAGNGYGAYTLSGGGSFAALA